MSDADLDALTIGDYDDDFNLIDTPPIAAPVSYVIPNGFAMALQANGFTRPEPSLRVGDARIALRTYDPEKLDRIKTLMRRLYSDESVDLTELDTETLHEASFGKFGDMGEGTVGNWVGQRDSITIVVVCPRGSLLENYFITDVLRDMVDTLQVTVLVYDSQYKRDEKVTNAVDSFMILVEELLPWQAVVVQGVNDFTIIPNEEDLDLHDPKDTMVVAFGVDHRCGQDLRPAVRRYEPSLIVTMARGHVRLTIDNTPFNYGTARALPLPPAKAPQRGRGRAPQRGRGRAPQRGRGRATQRGGGKVKGVISSPRRPSSKKKRRK